METVSLLFVLVCFIWGYSEFFWNIPIFICAVLFCIFLFCKNRKNVIFTLIVSVFVCVFGNMYCDFFIKSIDKKADNYIERFDGCIKGTVLNDVRVYDDESRFTLKTPCGNKISIRYDSIKEIHSGVTVEIKDAVLNKISYRNTVKNKTKNLISENCLLCAETNAENLKVTGIDRKYAFFYHVSTIKMKSFNLLLKYMNFDEAATAYAMFSSDKTYLSDEFYDSLIKTGTVHLATVSGFHFVFLGMIVMAILKFFLKSYRKRIFVLLMIMSLFAFYIGMTVSVARAYVFFVVINSDNLFYIKRMDTQKLFLFVMAVFLLISPTLVFDASFILTFVATGAIVFLSNPVNSFVSQLEENPTDLTSLVITLVMIPVVFSIFGRISLVSVFSNLFVELSAGIILFLTGVIFVLPIFALPFSFFLKLAVRYFIVVVKLFSKVETVNLQLSFDIVTAFFIVAVVVATVCFIFKRNRKTVSVFIVLLIALSISICRLNFSDTAYVTFLDNKTSTGIVLTKNSHHGVIATTDDFYYYHASSALKYNETIDFWFITEKPQMEKINELRKLYNIKEIIIPPKYEPSDEHDFTILTEDTTRKLKGVTVMLKEYYTKWLYARIESGGTTLYVSESADFGFDELPKIKNSSVLFIRGRSAVMEDAEIHESTKLYSAVKYNEKTNIITPYSIGIITPTKCSFQ